MLALADNTRSSERIQRDRRDKADWCGISIVVSVKHTGLDYKIQPSLPYNYRVDVPTKSPD